MAKDRDQNPKTGTQNDDPNAQPQPGGTDGPMNHSYTGDGGSAAAGQGQGNLPTGAAAPGGKTGAAPGQAGKGKDTYQCRVLKGVHVGGTAENPGGRKVGVGEVAFFTEEEIAEEPTAFEIIDSNQSIRTT